MHSFIYLKFIEMALNIVKGLIRAEQTVEEKRRLSYCGTDQYMSPEIMLVCVAS